MAAPDHPSTIAMALPAQLAAELAGFAHLTHEERVRKINQGVRGTYMRLLNPIHMSDVALWQQLADRMNRQCDEFIMAANKPDAKGLGRRPPDRFVREGATMARAVPRPRDGFNSAPVSGRSWSPLQAMWSNLRYWADVAYAEVPLDAKGRPDKKALRERAEARVMVEKVAKDLRPYIRHV